MQMTWLKWFELLEVGDYIKINYLKGTRIDIRDGIIKFKGTSQEADNFAQENFNNSMDFFYSNTYPDNKILFFKNNFVTDTNRHVDVKLIDTNNKKIKEQYPEYFI